MLRLIQPKDGGCVSSEERPNEKGPVAANGNEDGDREGEAQHENTDEPNHMPSHTVVTKPATMSTPPAVEKASPGLGKLTYNPITHAPSMSEFMSTGTFVVLIKIC